MGEAIAGEGARVQGDIEAGWASPVGIGEARARGTTVSAGHSLRRQNYSFVTLAQPAMPSSPAHTSGAMHKMRVVIAVATACALDFATFASISMLITGN